MTPKESGRKGGEKTAARGPEYYAAIGRRGGQNGKGKPKIRVRKDAPTELGVDTVALALELAYFETHQAEAPRSDFWLHMAQRFTKDCAVLYRNPGGTIHVAVGV